jgi:hypothetical protein
MRRYVTYAMFWGSGFWFRVLGYGLWFGLDHEPLFSERYGFQRVYRIRRLAIKVLTP